MIDEDLIQRSAAAIEKAQRLVADESTALGKMAGDRSSGEQRTLTYARLLDNKSELRLLQSRHKRMLRSAV